MSGYRDLTNQKFGRLTVLSTPGKNGSGNYLWNCQCDCGSYKTLSSDHLVRKKNAVKSCGCYRNDQVRARCSPEPNETAFRLLVGVYKKRARIKNIEFSLSDELFREITSSDCSYCGCPPEMVMENRPKTGLYRYSSIDRKNPAVGYTKENSSPCCKICNYMKWTLTEVEFLSRIRAIARRIGHE